MPCIYCLLTKAGQPKAKAHIFPESIFGDHEELFLTEEAVCLDCNQGFSHAESAFKDSLGMIPLMVGPGRNKKGRPTKVNVPGINAVRDPRDPRVSINLGRQPWITSDGRHVRPALKKGERIEFTRQGQRPDGLHTFRITQQMRLNYPLVRILTKIGFETICLHRGSDYCADPRWHRIRGFIVRGEGRRVFAIRNETEMPVRPDGSVSIPVRVSLVPIEVQIGRLWVEEWIALITIGMTFMLDMTLESLLLPALFDGPLREGREFITIHMCEGKGTRLAV